MKAALIHAYGSDTPIEVTDTPTPLAKAGEVQIKVHASTVQTGDWRVKSLQVPGGMAVPMKLIFGFGKPKNPIFGTELSGTIAAVGEGVTRFKVGDEVVATTGMAFGAHAEYCVLPEKGAIVAKPTNLSHQQAASLPFGLMVALDFLVDKAQLQSGESVLVNGASGATGTAAVQIARRAGAKITAVCRQENFELVKSLGAHDCIDYRHDDALLDGRHYDVIYDCVGNLEPHKDAALAALNPKGRLILITASLGQLLSAPFHNLFSDKTILGGTSDDSQSMLKRVVALAASGEVVPVVDAVYPLSDINRAYEHVASRHKKGNVILEVA